MLRWLVLVLLLLNVGIYARGQGWLLAYGWGVAPQHEPQRVAQQIRPDALVILPGTPASAASMAPDAAASAPAAATSEPELDPAPAPAVTASEAASTVCWQATDLDPALAEALRPVLSANFPDGAWVLDELGLPARWMVYMGKFPNTNELARKRQQLTDLNVKFSLPANPAWASGLSLGVFSSQDGANTALQELVRRGVRSARVVQERPSTRHYRLRLPALSGSEQAALAAVRAVLADKTLDICPAEAVEPAAR